MQTRGLATSCPSNPVPGDPTAGDRKELSPRSPLLLAGTFLLQLQVNPIRAASSAGGAELEGEHMY